MAPAALLLTLDLLGIQDSALVIGDASVAARLCDGLAAESARAIMEALQERNYSAYSVLLEELDLTEAKRALLKRPPYLKGDLSVLQCLELFKAAQPGLSGALEPLKKLWTALERLATATGSGWTWPSYGTWATTAARSTTTTAPPAGHCWAAEAAKTVCWPASPSRARRRASP